MNNVTVKIVDICEIVNKVLEPKKVKSSFDFMLSPETLQEFIDSSGDEFELRQNAKVLLKSSFCAKLRKAKNVHTIEEEFYSREEALELVADLKKEGYILNISYEKNETIFHLERASFKEILDVETSMEVLDSVIMQKVQEFKQQEEKIIPFERAIS